jgi:hypothetical protein
LFSGSSKAGLFSPNDYNECIFQNMKDAKNDLSAFSAQAACKSKFPNKPKKGPSGIFGPKNYDDCILKYGKGVENAFASAIIMSVCSDKFKKSGKPKRSN